MPKPLPPGTKISIARIDEIIVNGPLSPLQDIVEYLSERKVELNETIALMADQLEAGVNVKRWPDKIVEEREISKLLEYAELRIKGEMNRRQNVTRNSGIAYDVALSFAGEDRKLVEPIAEELKRRGFRVFYDRFEQANLWGKNLYDELSTVYKDKSSFCVIFCSSNYVAKKYTNHERMAAQARAFNENFEYILPIRIDETEISGLLPTVGYIKFDQFSMLEIVSMIEQKILSIESMNPNRG